LEAEKGKKKKLREISKYRSKKEVSMIQSRKRNGIQHERISD